MIVTSLVTLKKLKFLLFNFLMNLENFLIGNFAPLYLIRVPKAILKKPKTTMIMRKWKVNLWGMMQKSQHMNLSIRRFSSTYILMII
jgi:hypothetical protein